MRCGACMGPVPVTDEEARKLTEEILKLLSSKHDLLNMKPKDIVLPMYEARKKVIKQLQEAIKEVMYQDRCETF